MWPHEGVDSRYRDRIETLDRRYNLIALFELLVWPHEVEPWFHSLYRGRVETLYAKYNLVALFELLVWPHEVEPWFHSLYRGRVETLDANIDSSLRTVDQCMWLHEVIMGAKG